MFNVQRPSSSKDVTYLTYRGTPCDEVFGGLWLYATKPPLITHYLATGHVSDYPATWYLLYWSLNLKQDLEKPRNQRVLCEFMEGKSTLYATTLSDLVTIDNLVIEI